MTHPRDGQLQQRLIPLLNVLKSLSSNDRIIILAHLDDETRDLLYLTISSVLRSEKVPIETRLKLKKKLLPHKAKFRVVTRQDASSQLRKKKLHQLGGSPLKLMIDTALPLMLNLFPK